MEKNDLEKSLINENDRLGEILNYLEKYSNSEKIEKKNGLDDENLIYFFSSPTKSGIRIVDNSPKGTLARFAGNNGIEDATLSKKTGTFMTRKDLLENVSWDDNLNEVNKSKYIKESIDDNFARVIYTFIVSDGEIDKIKKQINDGKPNEKGLIQVNIENLYDFDLEYNFYKELSAIHKLSNNKNVAKENNDNYKKEYIKGNEKSQQSNNIDDTKKTKKSLINLKNIINRFFSKNNSSRNITQKK